MTPTQRAAMIRFTIRAEKAYRAWGEIDNANQARQHREILEAERGETRDELADAYSLLGQAQQRIQDLSCALLSAQGGQP